MHHTTLYLRPSILVVDDEAAIREALALTLADRYVVHAAAAGGEGRACLHAHPIAAIILDAILQEEHGLDLVEPFRMIRAVPILLLTGHGSEELAAQAVHVQVQEYRKKPPDLGDLHAALARLIGWPPAPRDPVALAQHVLATRVATGIGVAEIAATVGVSDRHLRRRYRETLGVSLREHLLTARMREAVRLLRETQHTVAEIAHTLGYQSPRRFARLFRRYIGMPPSAFRR